jgi:hypothetical protein
MHYNDKIIQKAYHQYHERHLDIDHDAQGSYEQIQQIKKRIEKEYNEEYEDWETEQG